MGLIRRTLIRVTIRDSEQTISFLTNDDMAPRLAAGCSVNPADLEELLLATETYQHGFAAIIMAELMEFDKRLKRDGPDFIHQAIDAARDTDEPVAMAFQVIDEPTEAEALRPRVCELLLIDLVDRLIEASENLEINRFDEVQVHTGQELTDKAVTYILPREWRLRPAAT